MAQDTRQFSLVRNIPHQLKSSALTGRNTNGGAFLFHTDRNHPTLFPKEPGRTPVNLSHCSTDLCIFEGANIFHQKVEESSLLLEQAQENTCSFFPSLLSCLFH